jgi:hypothetical protein
MLSKSQGLEIVIVPIDYSPNHSYSVIILLNWFYTILLHGLTTIRSTTEFIYQGPANPKNPKNFVIVPLP